MPAYPVDRDELYDRVIGRYEIPRGVSTETADSVTDSVMDVVFEYLRERGLMMPEDEYQREYIRTHPNEL